MPGATVLPVVTGVELDWVVAAVEALVRGGGMRMGRAPLRWW